MRKKIFSLPAGILLVSLVLLSLQNCVKDKCVQYYTAWEPVYKTKVQAKADIKSNAPKNIERPGKIYIKGNYIFLNEIDKGVHVIDNSNPSSPRNIAFIDIPGSIDIAVKGSTLYSDFYMDLVAIDISDPLHIAVGKFVDNFFPERTWNMGFHPDSSMVVVDWIKKEKDIAVECGGNIDIIGGNIKDNLLFLPAQMGSGGVQTMSSASPFGMGGSMASMAIMNDYLYAVSGISLNILSINNPNNPVYANTVQVGGGLETLYPFKNNLFIGSSAGMFVYDVTNPVSPAGLGSFAHLRACDPVVADNNNAFVTLRSGVRCAGYSDQLDVLDITNIMHPVLLKTYPMANPRGLSKDGNILIICDGAAGLKFYDASNINALALKNTIKGPSMNDVIAMNGRALVVTSDGLYQYDYSNLTNIRLLSRISVR